MGGVEEPEQSGTPPEGTRGDDAFYSVVGALRSRARWTKISAIGFFIGLLATIILGLGFYLLFPMYENYLDAREATLNGVFEEIQEENRFLDVDLRKIVESKKNHENGIIGLKSLLRNQWTHVKIEDNNYTVNSSLSSNSLYSRGMQSLRHFVVGDTTIVYGWRGYLLRSKYQGSAFYYLKLPVNEAISGHFIIDDRIIFYTSSGKFLNYSKKGDVFSVFDSRTEFLSNNHIVIDGTVIIYGSNGMILRSIDQTRNFELVESPPGSEFQGHLAFDKTIIIYGHNGLILRSDDQGNTFDAVESGVKTRLHRHIIVDNSIIIYGWDGTVLRSSDGGHNFDPIMVPTRAPIYGSIVFDDVVLIYDSAGNIMRSADGGRNFSNTLIRTETRLQNSVVMNSSILIYGSNGSIFRSTNRGVSFDPVNSQTDATLLRHAVFDNEVLLYGANGAILRSLDEGRTFSNMASPMEVQIAGHFIVEDSIVLYGPDGWIFRLTDQWSEVVAAIEPLQGSEGDRALAQFLDNELAEHIRDWGPVQEVRTALDGIINRRSALHLLHLRTQERLRELRHSPFHQWRREQFQLDLHAFLATCRGQDEFGAEITQACLAAWQEQQATGENWWRVLAERVPPGILLLFLLATTGSLYRYNLRLAGFHNSRADALELLAHGRSREELRDILAETPGEAINLATVFLGADKVEMGAIRAKLGQAEVELAKSIGAAEK